MSSSSVGSGMGSSSGESVPDVVGRAFEMESQDGGRKGGGGGAGGTRGQTQQELQQQQQRPQQQSNFEDGVEVMFDPVSSIKRRYKMAYIPSGFWSRLISRLIINLKRSGLMEHSPTMTMTMSQHPPIIYWRKGIVVIHSTGRFLVESIQEPHAGEFFPSSMLFVYKSASEKGTPL